MSAQLEDGYTPIAHELLEALSKARINGSQANILMFIFRYTYGFHRKNHEMGNAFIAEGTGIRKDQVKRELNRLIEMKIVKVYEESTHITARIIGINTATDEWGVNTKAPQGAIYPPGGYAPSREGGNPTPPPGGYLPPQDIYSFKNNTTTTDDDFTKVSKAYGRIHGKYDIEPKYNPLLSKLLKENIPAEFMIEVMEKRHQEKIAAGETVSGFGYYEPVFRDKLNPKLQLVNGNKKVDWEAISQKLEEAANGG